MNYLTKQFFIAFRPRKILRANICSPPSTGNTTDRGSSTAAGVEVKLPNIQNSNNAPYLHRELRFNLDYVKPREVWVENFDDVKEKKRGIVELHPKIFGTMPRLDILYENIKWQRLYSKVVLFSAKTRAEMKGGGRKPHPQKGLGKARQGSIRAPHMKGGGSCHGPRNPTSYFYMLPYPLRVHGLTSALTVKLAQDDLHIVDNINIPTSDENFILDLINERKWGLSTLIVDVIDIMPKNITLATDTIDHVNLMPLYGLNVYSILKHETLVLTLDALNELERRLLTILNTANPLQLKKEFEKIK